MVIKVICRLLCMVAAVLILTASPVVAWAQSDSQGDAGDPAAISVRLNAEVVDLPEEPVLRAGRVFVPLRGVLERLGVAVTYDADTEMIQLERGQVSVEIALSTADASRNGLPLPMDEPPFLDDGRTYVPLRFVAEAFGERVDWSAEYRQVSIWSAYARPRVHGVRQRVPDEDQLAGEPGAPIVEFTDEEFELLVRVINAEAYNEPFEGQVAVGAVVINRVLNPGFPNTIKDVIYQPNQFMVIQNGQINREVADIAYEAARAALAGRDPSLGAYYFYNPDTVSSEFLLKRPILIRIGGHVFAH